MRRVRLPSDSTFPDLRDRWSPRVQGIALARPGPLRGSSTQLLIDCGRCQPRPDRDGWTRSSSTNLWWTRSRVLPVSLRGLREAPRHPPDAQSPTGRRGPHRPSRVGDRLTSLSKSGPTMDRRHADGQRPRLRSEVRLTAAYPAPRDAERPLLPMGTLYCDRPSAVRWLAQRPGLLHSELVEHHPYSVTRADERVDAWSAVRLPFEPKGWLRDYRSELQSALRSMKATSTSVLYAEYAAPDAAFADLENVLLYNVGSGCYPTLLDEASSAGAHQASIISIT